MSSSVLMEDEKVTPLGLSDQLPSAQATSTQHRFLLAKFGIKILFPFFDGLFID